MSNPHRQAALAKREAQLRLASAAYYETPPEEIERNAYLDLAQDFVSQHMPIFHDVRYGSAEVDAEGVWVSLSVLVLHEDLED